MSFVILKDSEIIRSEETRALRTAYREKFGEGFQSFSYGAFSPTEDKRAAVVYVEALKEALTKDEPTYYRNYEDEWRAKEWEEYLAQNKEEKQPPQPNGK